MTLETFYEQFELLADAPNAVAKLREMVLQLAMRGKLTEREPLDEPIKQVLENIKAEKSRLIEARIVRSSAPLPPISEADLPFPMPENWMSVRLDDVGAWGSGGTPRRGEATYYNGSIPWLVIGDLNDDIVHSAQTHISELGLKNSSAVLLEPNTLLIAMYGSIGKLGITGIQCATNQAIAFCKPFSKVNLRFLFHLIREARTRLTRQGKGLAQQNISQTVLKKFVVGLPPLEEQKRIVAKVDELMALCDDLETQQQARAEARSRLNAVALGRLSSATDEASFKQAWTRIGSAFDTLYSTSKTIADLRKTILQLAVQGKLVRQDPDDEPAEKLLEQVKAEVTSKRKLKKTSRDLLPVSSDEIPFYLPKTWARARLGDLIISGPTNGYSPKSVEFVTPVKSLMLSATTSGKFDGGFFKYVDEKIAGDSPLWLKDGDILVQRGNTIEYVGVSAIYRGEPRQYIYPDLMMKLRFSSRLSVKYIHMAMSAANARDYLRQRATGTSGTMPKINQSVLTNLPLPVPPKTEQKLIVAKVDELMALVDELEAGLLQARGDSERLLGAVIQSLLSSETKQPVEA